MLMAEELSADGAEANVAGFGVGGSVSGGVENRVRSFKLTERCN
jgi:hypothetical protein